MRQSKKLILLAALLTGFQLSTQADAAVSVALETITGTANIGTSINVTVTTPILATPVATDVACVAIGTAEGALITSAGLNPLAGFRTAAFFWASQTSQTATTFTDAEGDNITGLTGVEIITDETGVQTESRIVGHMSADIVVGCGTATGEMSGDANSTRTTVRPDGLTYDILIELVVAADWFTEVDDVVAYGEFHAASLVPEKNFSPTDIDRVDAVRPVGPTASARRIGNISLNAVEGAYPPGASNINASEIIGGGTSIDFTGGSFVTAGIGDVLSLNVTVPSAGVTPIIIKDTSSPTTKTVLKADLGLGGGDVVVYDRAVNSSSTDYHNLNFHFNHTIVADQTNGAILDEASTPAVQIVTFYTEDEAGNQSSLNQKDLVASQLTANMEILIFDKSYQLVAADVNALADGDAVSRGKAGDSGGIAFTPSATGAALPTTLNLTVDITSGAESASIDFNLPGLRQGSTGFTVNLTNLNASPPIVWPGSANITTTGITTTGTIADGSWSIAFGGIDGAGNPLLSLTIANITGDLTPPDLPDFAPKAVTGDPETSTDEMVARGTNSELLSAANITLGCDDVATGATELQQLSWTPLTAGADISKQPQDNSGFVIPNTGAQCTWTWTGTDIAGNVGTVTSGLLPAYNPVGITPTPDFILLVSGTTDATAGATYDVKVQILDAENLGVFGIAASANETDLVTVTTAFIPDTGACSFDADCTLVYSGTGVTDGVDNLSATLNVTSFASDASLNFTVTNKSAGVNVFTATWSPNTAVTGTSGTINTTADAQSAVQLSLNDPSVNITAGANYWVNVELVDQFANRRTTDADFVEISTNVAGATIPPTAIKISTGYGGFWTSTDLVGAQTLWARGLVGNSEGSLAHTLDGVPALTSIDGADVPADNGNFIYLNVTGIAPEAELIRIWRDVDGVGTIAYATFVPAPGNTEQKVILYTPDNTATVYKASQETANNASAGVAATASKQAFASIQGIDSPYELMAETMMQSKQAAISSTAPAVPIFATLTPDAISMINGVAPSFKAGEGLPGSGLVSTEPLRAIDNIAPASISQLRAVDTPADAGGSISVSWLKSVDDRMLIQNTAGTYGAANGASSVPGVTGYNIYRKAGAGDFAIVGTASAGDTSFEDHTVFNGLRYTYAVSPFDADNVAPAELERTSMAIRNNVRDASGNFVMGLFGADNSVGFDDFFIFADFFGQTAADAGFDPAFDLSPNNRVDLDDFFVFADYFGRGIVSSAKVVPMLAGLNSDANLILDAGAGLPIIGEELTIAVNLEDYVELRGYGLNLTYDPAVFEFVGPQVEDNLLGEGVFAQPRVISRADGQAQIISFGETVAKGDLGLNLVFRSKVETEGSYIEISDGLLRDGTYGVNDLRGPVSLMVETRPEVYALNDNYPNPFNPETTIKYQLPEAGPVTLEVYNMLGQVVRTLVNEHQTAGRKSVLWDARNDRGQPLSSGMYFYHVEAGQEFQSTKKMLLLK
jgi:hypothetical protein